MLLLAVEMIQIAIQILQIVNRIFNTKVGIDRINENIIKVVSILAVVVEVTILSQMINKKVEEILMEMIVRLINQCLLVVVNRVEYFTLSSRNCSISSRSSCSNSSSSS